MATYIWVGGNPGDDWSDLGNWSVNGMTPTQLPGSTDDVQLPGGVTVDDDISAGVKSITFTDDPTSPSTLNILSGSVLTVDDQITGSNDTINIESGGVLQDTGAGLTVDAAIEGSGEVIANAGGTLTINGPIDTTGGDDTILNIGDGDDAAATLDVNGALGADSGPNPAEPSIIFDSGVTPNDTLNLTDVGTSLEDDSVGPEVLGFQSGDTITLPSLSGSDTFQYNTSDDELVVTGAAMDEYISFGADSIPAPTGMFGTDSAGTDTITICFLAGTRIRTPDGEVAIETLERGDLVLTTHGEARPVAWLGKQTVSARFADPLRSWPILIRAGALGENVPSRDLYVSPDHALLVDGVLIQAGALVNESSVVRVREVPSTFVYYHVELEDHSLILAEDTPAETFVDNVDRLHFDNWAEHEALYPNGKTIEELPYPRAKSRRQVPVNIRVTLADRAAKLAEGAAANAA